MSIEKLTSDECFARLCKLTGKWGMHWHISHPEPSLTEPSQRWDHWYKEAFAAAPWLTLPDDMQSMMDLGGYVLFDSEEECQRTFGSTVGDDGPTKLNPYDGPGRVYACTYNPEGQCWDENT